MAVHSDLLKSGIVPNKEKSVSEPVQVISWLGVVLNTIDGSVQATDERTVNLTSDLGSLLALFSQQSVSKLHVKIVARLFHFLLARISYPYDDQASLFSGEFHFFLG